MELKIKECETLIGLVKLKNTGFKSDLGSRVFNLSNRKIDVLERLFSFTNSPSKDTIENIAYLINLPIGYVYEWFKRKNETTLQKANNYDEHINLKVLINICLFH
ncbi:Homeobox protein HD-4 [Nosema granulosis]|uniref:Homeobox protein HD-4 n=1 Tax=Nosema granulosis TaxID=83296 RepID=A0A9P6GVY0_9MICR|nr:Homeobox protein HD-4 [Nosema granulosis]